MTNQVNNYPDFIVQRTEEIIASFDCDELAIDRGITQMMLCDLLLNQWVNGSFNEEGAIWHSEESFMEFLGLCQIETALHSLQNKGLIDSVEDETGESVFFLTDSGKQEAFQAQTTTEPSVANGVLTSLTVAQ